MTRCGVAVAFVLKTYGIAPSKAKRQEVFSRRSGISRSQLVDRIANRRLYHFEKRGHSPDDLLRELFPDKNAGVSPANGSAIRHAKSTSRKRMVATRRTA